VEHKIKIMFNRIVAVACLISSLFGMSDDRISRQVVVMEGLFKSESYMPVIFLQLHVVV